MVGERELPNLCIAFRPAREERFDREITVMVYCGAVFIRSQPVVVCCAGLLYILAVRAKTKLTKVT